MLTIQVVTSIGQYRMMVDQVEFVRTCPHCDQEFLTIDPDQRYPNASHKEMAYRNRLILTLSSTRSR